VSRLRRLGEALAVAAIIAAAMLLIAFGWAVGWREEDWPE
jgi:hypothetical protein